MRPCFYHSSADAQHSAGAWPWKSPVRRAGEKCDPFLCSTITRVIFPSLPESRYG
jgi:hypothetical protein